MAPSELDSKAEFARRAQVLGVGDTLLQSIKDAGLDTYGRFAFSVAYFPGQADEQPLVDLVTTLVGGPPTPDQMASVRRLFWESHTLALADLKQRSDHGSDSVSKKLPTSERKMRSEEQRTRLTGLVWGPDCEPSHQLVDRFVAMCEEGVITYVKPELCTSRSHEILNMKHGQSFALGSDGNLRLKQSDADMECSVSGEMKLREAFRRRSLAMDLAQMVTYTVSEEWTSYLFMTLQRDAPRGFKQINIAQLIAADKRLWILMSEQSKGNVSAKPPADKPCDALLKHISSSPEVLNFLSPQPDIPDKASLRYDPYHPKPPKPGKGKGKDGKGSGPSDAGQPLPEGCTLKKSDGKPICGFFNRGKCWRKVKAGKRCPRGLHICWKSGCRREKPAYECTHTD